MPAEPRHSASGTAATQCPRERRGAAHGSSWLQGPLCPRLPTAGAAGRELRHSRLPVVRRALPESGYAGPQEGQAVQEWELRLWTLLCGWFPSAGNPHQHKHPPPSSFVVQLCWWERRAGAGAARDCFGTKRCHCDPCPTPGPPAAVFGPWGFIVSTRHRLTLETLGAEYSFANTLLLTLFCWGGVQFAEHPKARGTTGAKAAPIGNATAIGAPSPRVAGGAGTGIDSR